MSKTTWYKYNFTVVKNGERIVHLTGGGNRTTLRNKFKELLKDLFSHGSIEKKDIR
jgi:hypothetical protein